MKVKTVDRSCAVLLSNGELLTWGANEEGQLGIPRCYLDMNLTFYDLPQNVNQLNKDAVDSLGNLLNIGGMFLVSIRIQHL